VLRNWGRDKADAEIHGILVSEMAPAGLEVICGTVRSLRSSVHDDGARDSGRRRLFRPAAAGGRDTRCH
jgi:hypothetical protein